MKGLEIALAAARDIERLEEQLEIGAQLVERLYELLQQTFGARS